MPRVRTKSGVKHFPYTPAGEKAAAAARRKAGRGQSKPTPMPSKKPAMKKMPPKNMKGRMH